MTNKDWAAEEAENLVWANRKTLATTRRQVAAALRAAYERGRHDIAQDAIAYVATQAQLRKESESMLTPLDAVKGVRDDR
jgi:hypothetical protein